jgi:transposase
VSQPARDRLADEQAALVRALVGGGPVPGGFDPGRVAATSAALARKRAREVARAWPVLAADLGEGFSDRFVADAARRPPPASGGALADGLAFARALARQGRLSPNARVEAMLATARLSASPVRLAATLAGPPRRLVVTLRAPGLGERWLSVPLR